MTSHQAFLIGFASGISIMALIANYWSSHDHREWCRIFDRQQKILEEQQALLENFQSREDEADSWKHN